MKENNAMLIFQGWKIDAFITTSGSLGLTVEKAKDSDRICEDSAPAVDICVDESLEVTADKLKPQAPAPEPSVEVLLGLLAEKTSDNSAWRLEAARQGCGGDADHFHALLSACAGFFTERGTTNEDEMLLDAAGFPREPYTGLSTPQQRAASRAHACMKDLEAYVRILRATQAEKDDTGLNKALLHLDTLVEGTRTRLTSAFNGRTP